MKKLAILLAAVLLPAYAAAQNSAVDKLFNKYKGKEGITTVSISPELFQMVKALDIEEVKEHDIPLESIAMVKIITIEDGWEGVNFYDEIRNDLDVTGFAEVMVVDDGDENVRIWMKAEASVVREFLLIVGGDDNVLVYITGNFDMKDLEGLAQSFDQDIDLDF
ncbi:MAG: DUF4252 domain-containing protein [Bacteroidales bacterium]